MHRKPAFTLHYVTIEFSNLLYPEWVCPVPCEWSGSACRVAHTHNRSFSFSTNHSLFHVLPALFLLVQQVHLWTSLSVALCRSCVFYPLVLLLFSVTQSYQVKSTFRPQCMLYTASCGQRQHNVPPPHWLFDNMFNHCQLFIIKIFSDAWCQFKASKNNLGELRKKMCFIV